MERAFGIEKEIEKEKMVVMMTDLKTKATRFLGRGLSSGRENRLWWWLQQDVYVAFGVLSGYYYYHYY